MAGRLTSTRKYAEVLAKIGAERSKLLNEAKLKVLMYSKGLDDVAAGLHNTVYKEEIAKIAPPYTSGKMESAIENQLIETYVKIIKHSPKKTAKFLGIFIKRIELENLKILVKTVNTELSYAEKLSRLYLKAENFLKRNALFEEAAKSTDLRQLSASFKTTEYEMPLSLGVKRYEETGSTFFLEILLDKSFYENLYLEFNTLARSEKHHAVFFTANELDGFLLLSLLRAKLLGYDAQWLRAALPRVSIRLSLDQFDALLEAPSYDSALKMVINGPYGSHFSEAATPTETIANAQKRFRQDNLNDAIRMRVTETFTISAPLGFFVQKETECANLTAISVGVENHLKAEDIQPFLLLYKLA